MRLIWSPRFFERVQRSNQGNLRFPYLYTLSERRRLHITLIFLLKFCWLAFFKKITGSQNPGVGRARPYQSSSWPREACGVCLLRKDRNTAFSDVQKISEIFGLLGQFRAKILILVTWAKLKSKFQQISAAFVGHFSRKFSFLVTCAVMIRDFAIVLRSTVQALQTQRRTQGMASQPYGRPTFVWGTPGACLLWVAGQFSAFLSL